jgi:cytochrome c biogenesis protein CcmG, thiol:disulfide interchange protein DsbE
MRLRAAWTPAAPGRTMFVGTVVAVLALAAPCAHALDAGEAAPPFEIATMDGRTFKSAEARGEVVVINLWATWCTFCREEMPALEAYYRRHKDEGLRLIAVSMDDAAGNDAARDVMRGYSYPGGVGRLSQLKGFGRIWRLPMTFVIDRDGILRKDGSEGEPKVDLESLEKVVTPLLRRAAPEARPLASEGKAGADR